MHRPLVPFWRVGGNVSKYALSLCTELNAPSTGTLLRVPVEGGRYILNNVVIYLFMYISNESVWAENPGMSTLTPPAPDNLDYPRFTSLGKT